MKFAEHLSAHITPEWRKQYINYEEMKAMLYVAVEEAPSMESADPDELNRHFKNFKETFFAYCDTELKKINTFYSEKLAEATRKFATLKSELSLATNVTGRAKSKLSDLVNTQKKNVPARKVQDLKLAFSEYYLSLILLQNYQNLNFTGFRKILKKHDKLLSNDQGAKYREEYVESAHFHTNTDIGRLINEVETTVTSELEAGDRQKAMKRLRVPPLGEKQTPWTTFKVGLFSGSFIVLFCAVLVSAVFHNEDGEDLKTTFKLFRAPLLIVEFLFLIGVNIYGWRSSGVNHVLIFELDPRNHLSEQDLMELAAIMGVTWTLSLLCFFYSPDLSIPRYFNPIGLVGVMMLFFLNPFKVLRHDARWWTVKVMWKCIAAPFYYVNFADFWLADQFNSLVTVFVDFHYIFYFYFVGADEQGGDCCSGTAYIISKSAVNCIPAWMRFAQCLRRYRDSREAFPHLVNAGKYSTTFFVVIFNALKTIYKAWATIIPWYLLAVYELLRIALQTPRRIYELGPRAFNIIQMWIDACILVVRHPIDDYSSDFDPFFYGWFAANIVSTIYAYAWDIWMDWGLMDSNAGDNQFLREEVVYSSKSFYYFAIVEDLVLRCSWLIAYFATSSGQVDSELMTSITAPLEVFRRFVWNFFRLENEHLNNCGKFRAVRDISVAPMDSSDHGQIIRMMDDLQGVFNRNLKKKPKKHKEDKRPLLGRQYSDQVSISISGLSTPSHSTPSGTPRTVRSPKIPQAARFHLLGTR